MKDAVWTPVSRSRRGVQEGGREAGWGRRSDDMSQNIATERGIEFFTSGGHLHTFVAWVSPECWVFFSRWPLSQMTHKTVCSRHKPLPVTWKGRRKRELGETPTHQSGFPFNITSFRKPVRQIHPHRLPLAQLFLLCRFCLPEWFVFFTRWSSPLDRQ